MPEQDEQIPNSDSSGDEGPHRIEYTHVKLLVLNEKTAEPVPGATVEFIPLDQDGDKSATTETAYEEDYRGMAEFKLAPRVNLGELRVSHEKYSTRREKLNIEDGETQVAVNLSLETGKVQLDTDDAFIGSLKSRLYPSDHPLREMNQTNVSTTLPKEGMKELEAIPGRYVISVDDPDVTPDLKSEWIVFTVSQGETTTVTFELDIDTQIPEVEKKELESLRESIETLRSKNNVDTAVQYYFSTVTAEGVRAFEEAVSAGTVPVGNNMPPEKSQSALLKALLRSHAAVESVLTGKRAVDLFTACNDMQEVQVGWDGSVDINRLSYWLSQDLSWVQSEFEEAKDATSTTISQEAPNLAEVGPLSDLVDEFEPPAESDEIEYTTQAYILTLYLEAIEQLLNQPELRARFNRTTY